ncbi:MAG: hypothetical protein WC554_10300 [Clostridia bacterium]|jgi:hypothetical protein
MGKALIKVEGKSKKDCARKLGRQINEARKLGMRKGGETLYMVSTGKVTATCIVES